MPRPWLHLPASTRHSLFTLAVVLLVLLPHGAHLSPPASLLALGVLAWRGWQVWRQRPVPPRWVAALLVLLGIGAAALGKATLRDTSVDLAVLLLALKTLEMKGPRDGFVLFFLGFFVLQLHFLFSQSLLTAAFMVLGAWGLLAMLVGVHAVGSPAPIHLAIRTAGRSLLWGTPLVAVLFVLFPRIAPLWGLPQGAAQGKSGLSDSLSIGQIASLALDESVAFRLRFDGTAPAAPLLYFRGPVLSRFDGTSWTALPTRWADAAGEPVITANGPPIVQDVLLEPQPHPWLFALDAVSTAPQAASGTAMPARLTVDAQWISALPIQGVTAYRAASHPQHRLGLALSARERVAHTELPAGNNPRTVAFAQSLRGRLGQAALPEAISDALLTQLRSGGYQYTLEPGSYGRDAADEFWFDRKLGFCEHISAAYVVALRAAGVPARIVTGYQGGERNPLDGWWTVRQSDAHAWAEYWQAGQGWVRVDPTAAVVPSRVGALQRLAPQPGLLGGAVGALNPRLWVPLRAAWDAANSRWNQWVLGYQAPQQLRLLQRLGLGELDGLRIGAALGAALALLGLFALAWQRVRTPHNPWPRLWERVLRDATRHGITAPPHAPGCATPLALATWIAQRHGPSAPQVVALHALDRLRYAPSHHSGPRTTPLPGKEKAQLQQWLARWQRLAWPAAADSTPSHPA